MTYFLVDCKCGHVSRRNYMPITFPVFAENGREASAKARTYARVKRNHKDAILNCRKTDFEGFAKQREINNNDPYLLCKSKHAQNQIMSQIEARLVEETNRKVGKYRKSHRPNLLVQSKKYTSEFFD